MTETLINTADNALAKYRLLTVYIARQATYIYHIDVTSHKIWSCHILYTMHRNLHWTRSSWARAVQPASKFLN